MFLAQPLHVRVQRTALGLVAVPPYATEQVVAVQGLAFPFNHMDHELEFRGRQIYFLLVDIEFEGVFVKSEGAVFRNDAARRVLTPFQHAGHAQDKFLGAERFGHIVVRSQFQPLDAVFRLGLGCQEDDGNVLGAAVPAQFSQYAVSVHARHHLVQQDQFRLVPARHFQRGQAVIGRQGRMARTFQIISHKI